jgi:hypothetical protein
MTLRLLRWFLRILRHATDAMPTPFSLPIRRDAMPPAIAIRAIFDVFAAID